MEDSVPTAIPFIALPWPQWVNDGGKRGISVSLIVDVLQSKMSHKLQATLVHPPKFRRSRWKHDGSTVLDWWAWLPTSSIASRPAFTLSISLATTDSGTWCHRVLNVGGAWIASLLCSSHFKLLTCYADVLHLEDSSGYLIHLFGHRWRIVR